MSLRPFAGPQTVSGSAQPCFGSSITAAITPPPDQFSNNLRPGSNETQCSLAVTSTNGFLPGDRVAVGPTAAFRPGIVAAASIPDQGMVKSITSGTVMVVQGLKKSHAASGEWCVLNEVAGLVRIRSLGGNFLYIGNASTVSATDLSVFDALAPGLLFDTSSIGTSQSWQTSTFWVFGTAADTFVASLGQI